MYTRLKSFRRDEDGAVTVDWVVLTAAIVGIAITVVVTVKSGMDVSAAKISHAVEDQGHGLTVP